MPVTLVVGGQWGDEGKAKIIDVLARDADYVVRYQGGANAGHTVVVDGERFAFHLLPSGILYPRVRCVLGGGMVVDPIALVEEIASVRRRGVDTRGRILLSEQAHLVLPHHAALDAAHERRRGTARIGTTGKGIAPAYADKVTRDGVRAADLRRRPADFEALVRERLRAGNRVLRALGAPPVRVGEAVRALLRARRALLPLLADTRAVLWDALDAGRRVLCEGAQGALLDLDHGTYPFVTSSSPAAGGACTGTGLPPTAFDRIIGIFKAYCTRVGNGPFPTELDDATGRRLRERGGEFGTTTGRPRRCGWFDAVAARASVRLNGVTEIALTKLDVLDGFEHLRLATAYRVGRSVTTTLPADGAVLERARPVYETMAGWSGSAAAGRASDLPAPALAYVRRIEECAGARVSMLSLGPQRRAIVRLARTRRGGGCA